MSRSCFLGRTMTTPSRAPGIQRHDAASPRLPAGRGPRGERPSRRPVFGATLSVPPPVSPTGRVSRANFTPNVKPKEQGYEGRRRASKRIDELPSVALLTVIHSFAANVFYSNDRISVLTFRGIRPASACRRKDGRQFGGQVRLNLSPANRQAAHHPHYEDGVHFPPLIRWVTCNEQGSA